MEQESKLKYRKIEYAALGEASVINGSWYAEDKPFRQGKYSKYSSKTFFI